MSTDTAKHAKHRLQGRQSKMEGDWFERMIEIAGGYYEHLGIAVLDKTPEPMKVIRPMGNGQFLSRFEKMAKPDFKGALCDGTTILIDAKHTETEVLRRQAVTSEQEKCFERYMKMGAHCFIVANIQFKDYYRIPWPTFRDMKKLYGRLYMDRSDLEPFRVNYSGGYLRFLDGISLRESEEHNGSNEE